MRRIALMLVLLVLYGCGVPQHETPDSTVIIPEYPVTIRDCPASRLHDMDVALNWSSTHAGLEKHGIGPLVQDRDFVLLLANEEVVYTMRPDTTLEECSLHENRGELFSDDERWCRRLACDFRTIVQRGEAGACERLPKTVSGDASYGSATGVWLRNYTLDAQSACKFQVAFNAIMWTTKCDELRDEDVRHFCAKQQAIFAGNHSGIIASSQRDVFPQRIAVSNATAASILIGAHNTGPAPAAYEVTNLTCEDDQGREYALLFDTVPQTAPGGAKVALEVSFRPCTTTDCGASSLAPGFYDCDALVVSAHDLPLRSFALIVNS